MSIQDTHNSIAHERKPSGSPSPPPSTLLSSQSNIGLASKAQDAILVEQDPLICPVPSAAEDVPMAEAGGHNNVSLSTTIISSSDSGAQALCPSGPTSLNEVGSASGIEPTAFGPGDVLTLFPTVFREGPSNAFGLRRRYYGPSLPTHDPEQQTTLDDLYDSEYHLDPELSNVPASIAHPTTLGPPRPLNSSTNTSAMEAPHIPLSTCSRSRPSTATRPIHQDEEVIPATSALGPFPNLSSFKLGEWCLSGGGEITLEKLSELAEIAQTPGFSEDISKTNWTKIFNNLGKNKAELEEDENDWMTDEGWKATPVSIPVSLEADGRTEHHSAGTLYHRNIVSIVRQKISTSPDASLFHYDPYELIWQPDPSSSPVRVYSEMYTSDAFMKAHRELQDSPPPPGCELPRVVVGLMFWSDETHVTDFGGNTKLWPCYMCFANESKYRRSRPTLDLCHQVAYFDQLSDEFKDYVAKRGDGKIKNLDDVMKCCKLELMHGQWEIILDDELLDAIVNGIVIRCQDGIERRFYIRIFTYSADYKEKVLLATIRHNGHCPCTRCLVTQDKLDQLGTPADIAVREKVRKNDETRSSLLRDAKRLITDEGLHYGHAAVEELMFPQSLHPVENAFINRLGDTGFDIFSALVVDLLHEFEIGAFKKLFIHLLRVIDACGAEYLLHEIDRRYRRVPAFGRTIRRFAENVSEMKRKAGRDYEDLLQCAIPVFECVVPDPAISQAITSILLICAEWHALAKLRMHTDATLQLLEEVTINLGAEFRKFDREVCAQIQTRELEAELAIRVRRMEKKAEEAAKKVAKNARKAEVDAKKAAASAKKAEAIVKKAEASAKKAEASAKKAEASAKKAEASTKKTGPNTLGARSTSTKQGSGEAQSSKRKESCAPSKTPPQAGSEVGIRRPGRPKKNTGQAAQVPSELCDVARAAIPVASSSNLSSQANHVPAAIRRGPGRPRKDVVALVPEQHPLGVDQVSEVSETIFMYASLKSKLQDSSIDVAVPSRRTGLRPRKQIPQPPQGPRVVTGVASSPLISTTEAAVPKRGRGRPRKIVGANIPEGHHMANQGTPEDCNPVPTIGPTFEELDHVVARQPSQETRSPATLPDFVEEPQMGSVEPNREEASSKLPQSSELNTIGELSQTSKNGTDNAAQTNGTDTAAQTNAPVKPKLVEWNFGTPKFHFLGDYVSTIRLFGTTDSYSSQTGELMHRLPKRWYRRSSKINPRRGVLKYERKVARVREIRRKLNARSNSRNEPEVKEQILAARMSDIHHYIGRSQKVWQSLLPLAATLDNGMDTVSDSDPLAKSFFSDLRGHLLPRLIAHIRDRRTACQEGEAILNDMYPDSFGFDQSAVFIQDHRIYSHKLMRLKYTTYDVRRMEDVVHTDSDVANIMVCNPNYAGNDAESPYLYARVLGIYHANVSYTGEVAPGGVRYLPPCRLEFLWVRWYNGVQPAGDKPPLPLVSFPQLTSQGATSFLDPDSVLRACHIIPRFCSGKVHEHGRGFSDMAKDGDDWHEYYVNRFVDRDMYMRYHIGMAVGHHGIWPTSVKSSIYPPVSTSVHAETVNPDGDAGTLTTRRVRAHPTGEGGNDIDSDEDSDMDEDDPINQERTHEDDEEQDRDYLMHGIE